MIGVHWGNTGTGTVKLVEADEFGCAADTMKLIVHVGNIGIEDADGDQLSIWPVPSKGSCFIEGINHADKVECFDHSGRNINVSLSFEKDNLAKITFPTSANGLYYIRVSNEKGVKTFKQMVLAK